MKHLRKFLTTLLLFCTTVATAHDFVVGGIYYNILSKEDKTVAVTYEGDSSDDYSYEYTGSVVIPENVTYNGNTYSVTSIERYAFSGCSRLTSITIGNSVTSIGGSAFYGCTGLKEVHISDLAAWCNIEFGSYNANPLYYAKNLYLNGELLTNLIIPDGVTKIKNYAFYGCTGLTSVTIPNSVTRIGDDAFYNTGWYNNQPDGILKLSKWVIGYKGTAPSGELNINKKEIGIADGAFKNCSDLTAVSIGNNIKSIGSSAFYGCSGLTSVTIGNSVTSIGEDAFYGCSGLTSVTIGNSVTSIERYAFEDCSGLKEVHISDLSAWCNISFANYSSNPLYKATNLYLSGELVTDLVIPDGISEIKNFAFENCTGLTSVTIPNSVTSIGGSAFSGCSGLTNVTIPNSVTSINDGAFRGCSGLTSVTIPNSVTSIGGSAFSYCSRLTSVTIPNSVTSIGYEAFYGCTGLTNVTIPNSVTSIGGSAFYGCTGLTNVTIPNSVTSIGSNAFFDCSGLKEVHISDLAAWCNIEFGSYNANPLYYAKNLYLNGELLTNLIIPDGVTKIKNYAFYNSSGLTNITIPNSVTSISEGAFRGCTGLTSVTIGNSVTSIGNSAFSYCTGLTSVTIGNSVTSIGEAAFRGCKGIKKIRFEDGCETLALGYNENYSEGLFYDCPLDTLYLGRNLSYESNYSPFYDKTTLTSVTIGNSVTSIGEDAFSYCTGLTSVTIGNSVTSIGDYAFSYCTGLTSITIPNSVTSIGDDAFYGCSGLKEIYVKSKTPIELNYDPFGSAIYDTTALIVPLGSKENYRTSYYWKNFKNIAEFDYDKEELYKEFSDWTSTNTDNSTTSSNSYTFEAVAGVKLSFDWEVSSEEEYDWFIVTLNGAEIVKESGEKSGSYEYTFTENGTYTLVAEYTKDDEYSEGGNYGKIYNIQLGLPLTDVEEIQTDDSFQGTKNVYYDLNGRKVENPTSGIYIINGKKVFVK